MPLAILVSALLAFVTAPIFSESTSGTGDITASTSLNFVVATTMETKAKLTETVRIPLLAGGGALTKDNNLQIAGAAELSPVSVNGTLKATLTPIAFLQFSLGGSVGSGWNIPFADGLRKNEPVLDSSGNRTGAARLTGGAFDGLVWSVTGGALFQFDAAALAPGDWHHVVFQTYHAARYRALTSAGSDESWLYEADAGENRNGWNYYGNYFLGYRMPLRIDLVGVLVEEDLYLYGTDGGSRWGDDLSRWTFGPVVDCAVSDRLSASVLAQWHTMRNFTAETENLDFYQDRDMEGGDGRRLEFYRVALSVTVLL